MSATEHQHSVIPLEMQNAFETFLSEVKASLGSTLQAIVLFGSAVEGGIRKTSNLNLIFFLHVFDEKRLSSLRNPARIAHAAINTEIMFVMSGEAQCFVNNLGLKSTDVLRGRRILFGEDPFQGINVSRKTVLLQLEQALFQVTLRLRNQFVSRGMREEQLAMALADATGPMRSIAAAILEIEGKKVESRKAALVLLARELTPEQADVLLPHLSEAREVGLLGSGVAEESFLQLLVLCSRISERVADLTKAA